MFINKIIITSDLTSGGIQLKIICQKEDLINGIQVVLRVVSSKTTIPILTGIYMSAQNGELTFKTTDLEIGLEKKVAVDILEEGAVVISAKVISEIVRKLPDTPLTLESNEAHALTIKYGNSQIKVNGFDPEEFPLMAAINGIEKISIEQSLLKSMIRQTIIALSDDDLRPVFTGMLVEIKNDGIINLVATDTHRIAFRQGKYSGDITKECSFIVPGKSMLELMRVLADNNEPIEIRINENQVFFKREDLALLSRLIEGQFPAYKQVMPTEFETSFIFESSIFSNSIERAALVVREDTKKSANIIKFAIEDNKIVIEATSADIGQIHEEIEVEVQGNAMEIAFNSKYLLDALRVINSEKGIVSLTGPVSPGIIKNIENDDFLYLILPVRTV